MKSVVLNVPNERVRFLLGPCRSETHSKNAQNFNVNNDRTLSFGPTVKKNFVFEPFHPEQAV